MNVAFIPLRAGGSRVGSINGVDKERADLGGYPLMAWTIQHAINSGVFDKIYAVTRSEPHARIALEYGCDDVIDRSPHTVRDSSPDIDWVLDALGSLQKSDMFPSMYSILRVTSPFRTDVDIRTMWGRFQDANMHSARCVTPVSEHPGKMWVIHHDAMLPLLPMGREKEPWHSQATQSLIPVYIQTAGMEMAWTHMTLATKTIAGSKIMPYIVQGFTALDINTRLDWVAAETAVKNGLVRIPESLNG